MCLYLPGNKKRHYSKVAKTDLIVYKKVKKILKPGRYRWAYDTEDFSKKRFKAAVRNFEYSLGYEYTNDNFLKETRKRELNGEGIHCYAIGRIRLDSSYVQDNFFSTVLVECIIPKGIRYYISNSEIVSQSLIIVKVIDSTRFAILSNTRQKY